MAGKDPMDATSSTRPVEKCAATLAKDSVDWSKVRIGVPKEYFIDGIDAEVRHAVESALKFYESKGAKRVEISLPHTEYAIATYYVVAVSEASSNLSRYDGIKFGVRPPAADAAKSLPEFYKAVRANFGPEVKRRIILGTYSLSSGYYDAYYNRACQVRRRMKEDFDNAFKSVDVILSPVAPTTAFKLGAVSDPIQMYLNDILTIPASLAGLPAISLPCGKDKAGLPIGMQLIAPLFEEKRLFQLGHSLEKEFYHES
jgi:aspartyl-tRNA(Asn)/glutamyl-tRNA(Gln) amidotransferase subunit A